MLKKWNRQFQYGIHMAINGMITIVFPFCTSYLLYLVLSSVQGFLLAFIGTIPNVWVMEMFDKDSKTFLQLMHIFYPVGNTLGSFLTAPFLSNSAKNKTSPADVADQESAASVGLFATAEHSQLWIPYLVITLLRLSIAALIFAAYFIKVSVWHNR